MSHCHHANVTKCTSLSESLRRLGVSDEKKEMEIKVGPLTGTFELSKKQYKKNNEATKLQSQKQGIITA